MKKQFKEEKQSLKFLRKHSIIEKEHTSFFIQWEDGRQIELTKVLDDFSSNLLTNYNKLKEENEMYLPLHQRYRGGKNQGQGKQGQLDF